MQPKKKDIDTLPDEAAVDDDEIDASDSDEAAAVFDSARSAAHDDNITHNELPRPRRVEDEDLERIYDVFQLPIRRSFDEEPTRKAHAPKVPRQPFTAEENTDIVDMNESWDNFRHIEDSEPGEQRRDTDH